LLILTLIEIGLPPNPDETTKSVDNLSPPEAVTYTEEEEAVRAELEMVVRARLRIVKDMVDPALSLLAYKADYLKQWPPRTQEHILSWTKVIPELKTDDGPLFPKKQGRMLDDARNIDSLEKADAVLFLAAHEDKGRNTRKRKEKPLEDEEAFH